ncbi:MAG: DNA mismatch repair protein MutS [Candidatus Omnitrophota bacterium]
MPVETETPMLKQYRQIKARHNDCILFFRLGDFYEMFYEDAKTASRLLDLVLTSRGKGPSNVPMCGIPYHAADNYIARLIKSGLKVAICEQVEDPALAKDIVRRDVIRVISSGTYLDEQSSDTRYLLCLSPGEKETGIAFIDPATGTIYTNQYRDIRQCLEILSRLPVYECIYPISFDEKIKKLFVNHPRFKTKHLMLTAHEDWCFNAEIADKNLREHFRLANLHGFGIQDMRTAVSSCGALLEYLKQMNRQPLRHVDRISLYSDSDYAYISPAAVYGLEIESLFETINNTLSPVGKRTLKFWLLHPLREPAAILNRQDAVTVLKNNSHACKRLRETLSRMPDLEKSISRLSCGYINPKDILSVRNALNLIPELREILKNVETDNNLFRINDIEDLRSLLEKAVNPDMPLTKHEGKVIHKGYNAELDELREIQEHGREWLRNFQQKEIQRTGINSLKVGFNKIFGYYIEITKANLAAVPQNYIRKQTLVNGERFIIQELKEYEDKILNAQDRILKIEDEIILRLRARILEQSDALHEFARQAGQVDALYSLSVLSGLAGYTAPDINDTTVIDIKDGRHPVVEKRLDTPFVPNDTLLDRAENHLVILTGPNMAGKSTYIRQTAILVILAQMGSYIPATSATIGCVDKIFTRIGAHDDIAKGQSTFMVEMNEMADIINNLTDRSLVILDEIGRGTSTCDGLSLAWALAEYLHQTKARTLFATHFHELTALAEDLPGVKNYNVAVKEWEDQIVFLHKIVPGGTDDSYGIYVAKLAGIPQPIILRAKKILTKLEWSQDVRGAVGATDQEAQNPQFDLFLHPGDPVAEELKKQIEAADLNTMTPLEALTFLNLLKTKSERERTKSEKTNRK